MSREYTFLDEWDVSAPIEAVHAALADSRTYPRWWRPVYLSVEAEGLPREGLVARHEFKGRLPYTLRTSWEITRYQPPDRLDVAVEGDLTGRGIWQLSERDGGVHVSFDWRVLADKLVLRVFTPVLRPLFRWNHNWSIERAREGLEPFARENRPSGGRS
jgi:uncharacterized protein YndB with AHSA1/START domain